MHYKKYTLYEKRTLHSAFLKFDFAPVANDQFIYYSSFASEF